MCGTWGLQCYLSTLAEWSGRQNKAMHGMTSSRSMRDPFSAMSAFSLWTTALYASFMRLDVLFKLLWEDSLAILRILKMALAGNSSIDFGLETVEW